MAKTTNVTNKHNAPMMVAGVEIAPGKTAAVDSKKLEHWSKGNAAKICIEQKIVVVAGSGKEKEAKPSEKEQLLEKATELGLVVDEKATIKEIKALISEKEKETE